MRTEHIASACLLAAGLILAALPAAAGDTPPSTEDDAVFRNGLDQYAHGNNVGAIATWESLLATLGTERGYKVLYNLGLAYQAIGDVTRAIERYDAFVARVGGRPQVPRDSADRAADARTRLEQLERTHGAVSVHAPTRGGLVLTRIGAAEPRAAGYIVWLAPGHHDLEIFVGTDHVKEMRLDVVEGQTIDVDTTPPAPLEVAAPDVPKTPPSPAQRDRPSTWIWIGAGATAVSFALPIGLFVVASHDRDRAQALGAGHSGYAEARSTFESARTAQYVAYALPAVLGLATIGYVVFRPSSGSRVTTGIGSGGAVVGGEF